jgi:hypothetical protein
VILLGSPPALALSMAHALRQAWRHHGASPADWQCLAAEPGQSLPEHGTVYLLGLDWRASVTEHEGVSNGPAAQLQHWRDQLQSQSRDYVVLYGNTARQWQQLAESLRLKAPQMDWSWLPASPAQRSARLRPYGCEQCSDPDCERRLFDALRSGRD